MVKRAGRIVKHQKTRVIDTGRDHKGESSPYWDWVRNQQDGRVDNAGAELWEPDQANPDRLPENPHQSPFPVESGLYSVGEVSKLLSGQQRKCFDLYVQEGKSEKEIAEILGCGYATVRTHLQRVRERFKLYV